MIRLHATVALVPGPHLLSPCPRLDGQGTAPKSTMLGPFQIRGLQAPLSQEPEPHNVDGEEPNLHGVVQVSAADYDEIASDHPRALLTYFDADDGDQITVRFSSRGHCTNWAS